MQQRCKIIKLCFPCWIFYAVLLLKNKTPLKCFKKNLAIAYYLTLSFASFIEIFSLSHLKEVLQIFPTLPAEACFREETCPILVSKEEEGGGGTRRVHQKSLCCKFLNWIRLVCFEKKEIIPNCNSRDPSSFWHHGLTIWRAIYKSIVQALPKYIKQNPQNVWDPPKKLQHNYKCQHL